MLRKKLTIILGIIAALTMLVAACAPQNSDAEVENPAVEEEMAEDELMVDEDTDDDMEVDDDSDDTGHSSSDGDADDMGASGAEDSGDGVSAGGDISAEMTDDEMIALIEEKLAGKHDIDRVLNGDKTYDEWVSTLDRMIGYGADINEEEKELIIQWLLNR